MEGFWKCWVLLIALYLASYQAAASPLSWQKECQEGPESWCQDFPTAVKCGALDYCQQMMGLNTQVKTFKCAMCKLMVVMMAKVMQDNSTDEIISKFLEKGCDYLPFQDWLVKCKKMVDTGVIILTQLGKQVQDRPEIVCGAFRLCSSRRASEGALKFQKSDGVPELDFPEMMSPFIANVPFLLYPQEDPYLELREAENPCGDCAALVVEMQEAVKRSPILMQSLVIYVKQHCDLLGSNLAAECKKYAFEYSHVFVQLLTYLLDREPKHICSKVRLCDSVKSEPLYSLEPAANRLHDLDTAKSVEKTSSEEKSHFVCDICKKMVATAENLVESNATEEKAIHELIKICYMLPHDIISPCKDFIHTYGKAVVVMILDATSPESVCILLKFCPRNISLSTESIPLDQLSKHAKKSHDGQFCHVCTILVKYIDDELEKNETQAAIGTALTKGCKLLPEALEYTCDQLMVEYEPAAVRLLVQIMEPSFVCTKIGVCPESHLIGMEACVRGPSYWCTNMETATQCQAAEYCKRHIWN
ncbi:prosaposin-like [Hemicordylus capensis]|uniref:prosaposin-like n=1 Tax=Hemicordylus capensis TaxID=884348 RepID=UPI00230269A9|nr:prosaposin-like [Hemicordylus capensis]